MCIYWLSSLFIFLARRIEKEVEPLLFFSDQMTGDGNCTYEVDVFRYFLISLHRLAHLVKFKVYKAKHKHLDPDHPIWNLE